MGAIVLTCPVTGDDFSTGIDIDRLSFEAIPDQSCARIAPTAGRFIRGEAASQNGLKASRGACRAEAPWHCHVDE